jgi:hypothetical protein
MARKTFKQTISEARNPKLKYTEEKTKGIIDKAIVELEGAESAQFTQLARRAKNMALAVKKLGEKQKEVNAQLSGMVGEMFDETADLYITKTVETVQFMVTLAKTTKPEDIKQKSEIDLQKVIDGVKLLVDKDLLAKIEALIELNTNRWMPNPVKPALTINKKISARVEEGLIDSAAQSLTKISDKVQDYFKKLFVKAKAWADSYDSKLDDLKAML